MYEFSIDSVPSSWPNFFIRLLVFFADCSRWNSFRLIFPPFHFSISQRQAFEHLFSIRLNVVSWCSFCFHSFCVRPHFASDNKGGKWSILDRNDKPEAMKYIQMVCEIPQSKRKRTEFIRHLHNQRPNRYNTTIASENSVGFFAAINCVSCRHAVFGRSLFLPKSYNKSETFLSVVCLTSPLSETSTKHKLPNFNCFRSDWWNQITQFPQICLLFLTFFVELQILTAIMRLITNEKWKTVRPKTWDEKKKKTNQSK